jgi:hypothetical protein
MSGQRNLRTHAVSAALHRSRQKRSAYDHGLERNLCRQRTGTSWNERDCHSTGIIASRSCYALIHPTFSSTSSESHHSRTDDVHEDWMLQPSSSFPDDLCNPSDGNCFRSIGTSSTSKVQEQQLDDDEWRRIADRQRGMKEKAIQRALEAEIAYQSSGSTSRYAEIMSPFREPSTLRSSEEVQWKWCQEVQRWFCEEEIRGTRTVIWD